MTTETHLETIVSLQHALSELARAQERLGGIPDWMQDLHEEHSGQKSEIEALEQHQEEAAHERREAEAAIEDEQGKLSRYQQQINNVKTQREYGALLQEIDTAKQQIRTLEEKALAAIEERDKASQELEAKREAFRELDERYTAELAKWEEEKPAVADRLKELEREVEELRGKLPRRLLSLFDRIFERHQGEALAPVRTVERPGRGQQVWSCGACNFRVRPQSVVQIRNEGSMVQCDSCHRILYVEEEPVEAQG